MLTNSEIADKLLGLANLLALQKQNPFKVKAYRRAARTIRSLADSVDESVRNHEDLTAHPGIGEAIANVIHEIVRTGDSRQIQALESQLAPEVAAITQYPQLDPARVLRVYKKLNISSVEALKQKLETGEIAAKVGFRMDQHIRRALAEHPQVLLYDADQLVPGIEDFLLGRCGASRAEATGDYRRRVEVVSELAVLVETDDFPALLSGFARYGGGTQLLNAEESRAWFKLSAGTVVRIDLAQQLKWGVGLIASTGSPEHLEKLAEKRPLEALARSEKKYLSEASVYKSLGLQFIPPELREGRDELTRAERGTLPALVTAKDIRGDLHAHSTSSDGRDTIEQMALAAQSKGLEYIGISDHSQSLKIARGLSEERLRNQLRFIDGLNGRLDGIRILKSAEVDILEDGSLDYPDDLLKELDYTICSIHSRFGLGKAEQTRRILRAMDNRYFTILGHATGRLLLRRPGYEIEMDRVIDHARQRGCFFEMNASPYRLDFSAEHARMAREAGVPLVITTDAHSTGELDYLRCGIDQARRAGLEKTMVLNSLPWPDIQRAIAR